MYLWLQTLWKCLLLSPLDFHWISHLLLCYGAEIRHLHSLTRCLSRPAWPFLAAANASCYFHFAQSVCNYWVTNDNTNNQFLIDYSLLRQLWLCFPPSQPSLYDQSFSDSFLFYLSFYCSRLHHLVSPWEPVSLSMPIAHMAITLIHCPSTLFLVFFNSSDIAMMSSSTQTHLYVN